MTFDPQHVKEIQKKVWSRGSKEDIYTNHERQVLDWSQLEVDEIVNSKDDSLIPINMADTLATHNGVSYAIAYVAEYISQFHTQDDLSTLVRSWIKIIGRVVTEERKAKRKKILTLKDVDLNNIASNGIEKLAAKLLKKNSINVVLQTIRDEFPQELYEAGSTILRRQMLFDKGLLVANLIRKGYNKQRRERNINKTTKN